MSGKPTIFVFGSNKLGIHGKGAAREARVKWGAGVGVGSGRTGNAYALPTKLTPWDTLPLEEIRNHVDVFLLYAQAHPELHFYITRVGCGLAGYTEAQIRPLFDGAPDNCEFTWLEKQP
jgi:hypothetical protein